MKVLRAATGKRLAWWGVGTLVFALWQLGSLPTASLESALAQFGGTAAPVSARCAGFPGVNVCLEAQFSVPGSSATRLTLRPSGRGDATGGWGYLGGTTLPGAAASTAFRIRAREDGPVLRQLRPGDTLVVELPDARQFAYRVTDARVAQRQAVRVSGDAHSGGLTLIAPHSGGKRADLWLVVNATLLPMPLEAAAEIAPLPDASLAS
jgi:hypothetical protein